VKGYLKPLMNQLTIPIMIIGLESNETFKINSETKKVEVLNNN
jgi:hypothetical protein